MRDKITPAKFASKCKQCNKDFKLTLNGLRLRHTCSSCMRHFCGRCGHTNHFRFQACSVGGGCVCSDCRSSVAVIAPEETAAPPSRVHQESVPVDFRRPSRLVKSQSELIVSPARIISGHVYEAAPPPNGRDRGRSVSDHDLSIGSNPPGGDDDGVLEAPKRRKSLRRLSLFTGSRSTKPKPVG